MSSLQPKKNGDHGTHEQLPPVDHARTEGQAAELPPSPCQTADKRSVTTVTPATVQRPLTDDKPDSVPLTAHQVTPLPTPPAAGWFGWVPFVGKKQQPEATTQKDSTSAPAQGALSRYVNTQLGRLLRWATLGDKVEGLEAGIITSLLSSMSQFYHRWKEHDSTPVSSDPVSIPLGAISIANELTEQENFELSEFTVNLRKVRPSGSGDGSDRFRTVRIFADLNARVRMVNNGVEYTGTVSFKNTRIDINVGHGDIMERLLEQGTLTSALGPALMHFSELGEYIMPRCIEINTGRGDMILHVASGDASEQEQGTRVHATAAALKLMVKDDTVQTVLSNLRVQSAGEVTVKEGEVSQLVLTNTIDDSGQQHNTALFDRLKGDVRVADTVAGWPGALQGRIECAGGKIEQCDQGGQYRPLAQENNPVNVELADARIQLDSQKGDVNLQQLSGYYQPDSGHLHLNAHRVEADHLRLNTDLAARDEESAMVEGGGVCHSVTVDSRVRTALPDSPGVLGTAHSVAPTRAQERVTTVTAKDGEKGHLNGAVNARSINFSNLELTHRQRENGASGLQLNASAVSGAGVELPAALTVQGGPATLNHAWAHDLHISQQVQNLPASTLATSPPAASEKPVQALCTIIKARHAEAEADSSPLPEQHDPVTHKAVQKVVGKNKATLTKPTLTIIHEEAREGTEAHLTFAEGALDLKEQGLQGKVEGQKVVATLRTEHDHSDRLNARVKMDTLTVPSARIEGTGLQELVPEVNDAMARITLNRPSFAVAVNRDHSTEPATERDITVTVDECDLALAGVKVQKEKQPGTLGPVQTGQDRPLQGSTRLHNACLHVHQKEGAGQQRTTDAELTAGTGVIPALAVHSEQVEAHLAEQALVEGLHVQYHGDQQQARTQIGAQKMDVKINGGVVGHTPGRLDLAVQQPRMVVRSEAGQNTADVRVGEMKVNALELDEQLGLNIKAGTTVKEGFVKLARTREEMRIDLGGDRVNLACKGDLEGDIALRKPEMRVRINEQGMQYHAGADGARNNFNMTDPSANLLQLLTGARLQKSALGQACNLHATSTLDNTLTGSLNVSLSGTISPVITLFLSFVSSKFKQALLKAGGALAGRFSYEARLTALPVVNGKIIPSDIWRRIELTVRGNDSVWDNLQARVIRFFGSRLLSWSMRAWLQENSIGANGSSLSLPRLHDLLNNHPVTACPPEQIPPLVLASADQAWEPNGQGADPDPPAQEPDASLPQG